MVPKEEWTSTVSNIKNIRDQVLKQNEMLLEIKILVTENATSSNQLNKFKETTLKPATTEEDLHVNLSREDIVSIKISMFNFM